MKYLKKYNSFNEEFVASKPKTAPTTTPSPTTTPRPTRPGVVPADRPGEEDAPLASKPKTAPTTTPTPTTTPRPTRPGVVPADRPGEEDAPLASVEDVIDRLNNVYSELTEKEKSDIDKYFEEK
jgi:hypothetical protein